jgi:hypothetical protein
MIIGMQKRTVVENHVMAPADIAVLDTTANLVKRNRRYAILLLGRNLSGI